MFAAICPGKGKSLSCVVYGFIISTFRHHVKKGELLFMRETARVGAKKLEGVFARGYGVVPKAVMLEGALSPEAKALYAYYCVMSGNDGGYQSSPREETILRALHMSHARFIRHRKTLIEQGYLAFSQTRRKEGKQFFENTRYLIVKAPRQGEIRETDGEGAGDLPLNAIAAVQEGIFAEGFGLVPRMPLFDEALSVEAKAAYVFLCVYANASTCAERGAHPSASLFHEKLMSAKRTQHAMNELIQAGYIRRERLHNGAFAGFSYILLFEKQPLRNDTADEPEQERRFDTAEMSLQELQNDTAENASPSPVPLAFSEEETRLFPHEQEGGFDTAKTGFEQGENETAQIETAENEPAENETAYSSNRQTNTTSTNTMQKNIRPIHPLKGGGQTDDFFAQRAYFDECRSEARAQIEADVLSEEYGHEVISSIALLMADVYAARGGEIRMNGRSYDIRQVASVFRELRPHHIEQVLYTLKNRSAGPVANMNAYLTSCLYNAAISFGAEIYRDGAGFF